MTVDFSTLFKSYFVWNILQFEIRQKDGNNKNLSKLMQWVVYDCSQIKKTKQQPMFIWHYSGVSGLLVRLLVLLLCQLKPLNSIWGQSAPLVPESCCEPKQGSNIIGGRCLLQWLKCEKPFQWMRHEVLKVQLLVDHAAACQQQQQAPLRLLKRASLQVFNALCVGDGASSLLSRHTIGFGTTEWLIPFILLHT